MMHYYDFDRACADLTKQVYTLADQHCPQGWRVAEDTPAPFTLEEMQDAWHNSTAFPVSADFSETSIYGSAVANVAFRAWHDALHVKHGLETKLEDELELARIHASQVEDEACKLLVLCDTAGQSYYEAFNGDFPTDQRKFVWTLFHLAMVQIGADVASIYPVRYKDFICHAMAIIGNTVGHMSDDGVTF